MCGSESINRAKRVKQIEKIYNKIYETESEQLKHKDILDEVIYQDQVCADFRSGKKFTTEELEELLMCRSAIQISNRTRSIKMAC